MRSLKSLIVTGMVTALAVSALAVPASAADRAHATIVNGIPDARIDVCIGSKKEIRSGLKYGGSFKKRMLGTKQLQFRKAGRGVCKGKLLAARRVAFPAGSDKTVVVTSKRPGKVLVFGNELLGVLAANPDSALALRHAADLGPNDVYFRWSVWQNPSIKDESPFRPSATAEEPFSKRDQFKSPLHVNPDMVMRMKATRASANNVLAVAPLVELESFKRYEYVFVGTRRSNAKLVPIVSDLVVPAAPPAS